MNSIKYSFNMFSKSHCYFFAIGSILIVCVLVSISIFHRTCTHDARQKAKLDFFCPLSKDDYETLSQLAWVLHDACLRIKTTRKKSVEFDYVGNEDNLQEALDMSKKIILSIDSRIVLPNIVPFNTDQCGNAYRECVFSHIEDLRELAYKNNQQYSIMISILFHSFEIYEAQSDIDRMLQSIILLESLCNSVQLDGYYSCIKSWAGYTSIVMMTHRAFEVYPTESRLVLQAMLTRVKLKLRLLVYELTV